MHVLVTGGTGFLGQHLVSALLARGDHPFLMGRDMTSAQHLVAAGATPVVADLRDHAAVVRACAGMDAVCHAGALSAPWGPWDAFYTTNVRGTAAVVDGCRRHNIRRLVAISSPSVIFTGGDHRNLQEDAPYPPRFTSLYSLSKKLSEDVVNAATDLQAVILRPKAIFGPGDRALLPRLIAAARAGRLPQIGDGSNLIDLTYVENVAHACMLALSSDAARGKTYMITNDEHVRLWDVIATVLRRLDLPTRLRRVSLRGALFAATLMEWRARFTGREPLLTRYTALILARTQTYDIRRAKRDLGYQPLISVAEGVERTIGALMNDLSANA